MLIKEPDQSNLLQNEAYSQTRNFNNNLTELKPNWSLTN